jgi:hypothetical protein
MLETKYPPVLTKHDFVQRYSEGEFGNRAPTWNTYDEWLADRYRFPEDQLYHIRSRARGGVTYYDQDSLGVMQTYDSKYAHDAKYYLSCMCPTEKTLIQGEVQQGVNGLEMFYSCIARPMREALKIENESVSGVRCTQLLRYYLCPNSYEWLQVLLDRYPEHVIEFTTFSVNWGTLPNFNTVVWEVRKY